MTLPKRLRINGREWELRAVPAAKLPDCYGRTDCGSSLILYQQRMQRHVKLDTIIHEVMHAILESMGQVTDPDTEERYVRALASGLAGVLADNPGFARWLCDYSKPKPK